MNIGLAIRKCRRMRDFTLDELAHKTKLSKSYLSLVESGKRNPSFDVLKDISEAIKIPLYLLVYMGTDNGEITDFSENLDIKLKDLVVGLLKSDN